jgi:WD40 repeat protein/energy-coupling factor transporter ATP-binding protein EcfA2
VPRPERPLESADEALLQFAADLRGLREKAGSPTYRELSRVAHYSPSVLSEAANGRARPSLAVTLAYVDACGGDRREWEDRWHTLGDRPATDLGPVDAESPPYVGLSAFQPDDADRFFGREKLVRTLRARIEQRRFVGVFGASGSGKSSLLRAGLVAGTSTPTVLFAPGPNPMEECAVGIAALTGSSAAVVRAELDADPLNLHLLIRQAIAREPAGTDLLLVIDQFEEMFTVCTDRDARSRFIAALVLAATADTSRTRVVIGVRADFYGHCAQYPELVEALHDAQVLVGPMSTDELREAITAPAARAGCLVETALVSKLISDTDGQDAVLPLVSHALLETWRRRSGARLTLAGYQASGGIHYAIARTAEDVHNSLDADQRKMAQLIFLRLIALGEGTEDTKRRVRQRELDADNPNTRIVLDELAKARLLTLHSETVEIAHEALIRSWPRLRDWLSDDREGLRIHRQLTEATDAWESIERDPGALYRGIRLARANDWAADHGEMLTMREREFLETSLSVQAAEQAADRRRTRRLRRLVALLAVLLLLASAAIVYAVRANRDATAQRDIALARKVVGDATALRATNPALASQLSLGAYRLTAIPETRDSLLATTATPVASRLTGHTADVMSVAAHPDSRVLATASTDKTVRLWDITNPQRPAELATLTGHTDAVNSVAFSPDGTMATASNDKTVRLWDITNPQRPAELATLTGHTDAVNSVAFSPDGTMATASNDKTVRLWDVRERRQIATLPGHTAAVRSVAFNPDGSTLATASNDKTVRLWNVRERREAAVLTSHTDIVNTAAFSADGRYLASGGNDYTVRLWTLGGSEAPRELTVLTGHTNLVNSVFFSRDGTSLITSSSDKTTRLENLSQLVLARHTDSVQSAVFSPDGRTLATASNDRTARLWDISDTARPRELAVIQQPAIVWSALFSPDGRLLATSDDDQTARLWDVRDLTRPRPLGSVRHTEPVWSTRFSPDGRTLATVGADAVRLWDVSNPDNPRELGAIAGRPITSVRFSPDGHVLATASADSTAGLWDVSDPKTPREVSALHGHTSRVTQVAFRPDGHVLATASWDHDVRLWDIADIANPKELSTLHGHAETVTSVAFRPDGRTLLSGSHDRTARLWDVHDPRNARESATLAGHTGVVISVAFSPDGQTLATGSQDRTARLWQADVDRAAARVCAFAYPAISREEWDQYFPGLDYQPPCP